jgi:flagella basal body P-ring formation protein FlgA
MISSAELLAAAVLAATLAPRGDTAVPAGAAVVAHVAASIAQLWNAPEDAVRLEWGRWPAGPAPLDDAPYKIVGSGRDGWFAVVFRPGEPEGATVRVRAGTLDTAWVASAPLPAGHVLAGGDVHAEPVVRWGPPDPARHAAPPAGWQVRRPLAKGEPISAPAIVPPTVVAAGDPIQVSWDRGAVRLRLDGVALHAARIGDPLRVRVEGRPRPLNAVVIAAGRASLAGPADSNGKEPS